MHSRDSPLLRGRGAPPRVGVDGRLPRINVDGVSSPTFAAPTRPSRSSGDFAAMRERSTAAPPASRSRSPIYWKATFPALMFAGPLGEVVGEVEAGTVVLEHQRYEDPFRGMWMSTRAEDGTLVWISHNNSQYFSMMEPPEESLWQRVYHARATPQSDGRPPSPSRVVANPALHPDGEDVLPMATVQMMACGTAEVPSEIALLDYYWQVVAPAEMKEASASATKEEHPRNESTCVATSVEEGGDEDEKQDGGAGAPTTAEEPSSSSSATTATSSWNQRYQDAVEHLLFHLNTSTPEQLAAAQRAVRAVVADFQLVAQETMVLLVEEMMKPSADRQIRAHPTCRHVFYHKKMLIQLCIDTATAMYGGEVRAQKAASASYASCQLLSTVAPRHLLCMPLMALLRFQGYTAVFSSIAPITSATCLFAPLAFAQATMRDGGTNNNNNTAATVGDPRDTPEMVLRCLDSLGADLNLKPHDIQPPPPPRGTRASPPPSWRCALSMEVEVYAGRDRRLYLLGGQRVLPALLPFAGAFEKKTEHISRYYRQAPSSAPQMAGGGGRRSAPPLASSSTAGEMDGRAAQSSSTSMAQLNLNLDASSPTQNNNNNSKRISYMIDAHLRRIRPELLAKWPEALNPDAFVDGAHNTDDCVDLCAVSDYIKSTIISNVAGMLGCQLPIHAPSMPEMSCTLCASVLENELRFVCCRNVERCCCICSHCYLSRVLDASPSSSSTLLHAHHPPSQRPPPANFADAVRCGAAPRHGRSVLMEPNVADLLHANGLNLRYLPFVYYRLPNEFRSVLGHVCEVELLARVAARLLHTRMCGAASAEDARTKAATFFLDLLPPSGANVERFWQKEMGPHMQRIFNGLATPFSTAQVPVDVLAERVQELSGVQLSSASLESMAATGNAYVEVEAIAPRIKACMVPTITEEEVAADAERLRGNLERLLLFWIGYAPKDCVDADQPFYLHESLLHE